MCRHLYNWSLNDRIEAYEADERTLSYQQQQNGLPALKKEKPWYKGVHSQVLQNVLKRLDLGMQAFFRTVKKGETPGFPKFRKKGQWDSLTYPQFKTKPDENGELKVSKIGDIKLQYHRDIPDGAVIKTMTIKKEGHKFFCVFSCEIPVAVERKVQKGFVGLDLGLIDFFYDSDGHSVVVPKFFRKSEKRLKRLQRRFSVLLEKRKKTKKDSKERKSLDKIFQKQLKALQKVHSKIKNQRHHFLHHTANLVLSKKVDTVVVEDLNIQGMKRRPKPKKEGDEFVPNGASAKSGLNKSISDVGWYSFLQILTYKAEAMGKSVLKVPPHYTSQDCSACGARIKKSLSNRTHSCTECGYVANRDHNAAINILRLGQQSLGLVP